MDEHDEGGAFQLSRGSEVVYLCTKKRGKRLAEPDVFEPKPGLPAPGAGFLGFVIDRDGRLWLSRKDTHQHARFFGSGSVAAAGQLRVGPRGEVVLVSCRSNDYPMFVPNAAHATVGYVVEHFGACARPPLSPHAMFRFWTKAGDVIDVDGSGQVVLDPAPFLDWMRRDELEEEAPGRFGAERLAAMEWYEPERPRGPLHPLREPGDEFEPAGPRPPFGLDGRRAWTGWSNFALDRDGMLLLGSEEPLELADGRAVVAFGRIFVEAWGTARHVEVGAEFREAGAYVRRVIEAHPLLDFDGNCDWTFAVEEDADSATLAFLDAPVMSAPIDADGRWSGHG